MRILTRGDLDGLTSTVFLTMVDKITEIRFAHPKDVQDGKVACDAEDIIVNLPFVPGCGMWFDHHVSEQPKLETIGEFRGLFAVAPSCARVIYNHFRKPEFDRFAELLDATDRLDAAQLTVQDVTEPKGWVLLGYTLDPRTGFGPEFQKYFRWLAEFVKEVPLEKVLAHPEVKKRVDRVMAEQEAFLKLLKEHTRQEGNVVITDFRGIVDPPVGNRFLVYTMYPTANVEARIHWGRERKTVNVALGHSIFNRTCLVNLGKLCAGYGGGGHVGAATCQLDPATAEGKIREIVAGLQQPIAMPPRPEAEKPAAAAPAKKAAPKPKKAARPAAKKKAAKSAKPKAKPGKAAKKARRRR